MSSLPLLGNVLAVLLDGISVEKCKPVRLSCLEAISVLLVAIGGPCPPQAPFNQVSPSEPCPWRLAQMFPGTVAALFRLCVGDYKQGSKVIAAAVHAFAVALQICTSNDVMRGVGLLSGEISASAQLMGVLRSSIATPPPPPVVVKGWDANWLTLCSDKIVPRVCDVLERCSAHTHWRVRVSAAQLCAVLIAHCSRSLRGCYLPAIERVLALSEDAIPAVAAAAVTAVDSVMAMCVADPSAWHTTRSGLVPRVWGIVHALPR